MKSRPNLNPEFAHLITTPIVKSKPKRVSIIEESIFKRDIIADEYRHEKFTNAMYELEIQTKLKAERK